MPTEDTIVAIATPTGRAGIGVVRISGDKAVPIVCDLVLFLKLPLENRHATVGDFVDPHSGRVLDQIVVTCFRKPHSYKAEDVVDVSGHCQPVTPQHLVECYVVL